MHFISHNFNNYQIRQIGLAALLVCSILIGVRPVSAFEHKELLEYSGIRQQLNALPELIKQATLQNLESCDRMSTAEKARTLDNIEQRYNPQLLAKIATQKLKTLIDEKHLSEIKTWLTSDSGRIIRKTDSQAENLDELEQNKLFVRLSAEPDWSGSRKELIQSIINEAGIHQYITALHTEIAAQGALLGNCNRSPATYKKIRQENASVRNDQNMIAFFMMLSLIEPTAVAYRELNDKTLNDYIAFSRSDAGKNYHASLIQLIPLVIREMDPVD